MCPWVGPHAPSFGRQLSGLPSCVEYLSPQGVLLPLVYGTTASPLWLELRGQFCLAGDPLLDCVPARLSPVASMAPGDVLGPVALEYRSCSLPGGSAGSPGCVQPVGCWFFPVPRPPYVCAVSRASWLLFTGVLAWFVVLCLRCPGALGSCSSVRPLGVVCRVCGVLGSLAPVHRCARWVYCVACAVSWATWLLFTGARAGCVALRVRCPGPLGSCSPVCLLCLLFCLCGVVAHLAPVHRCARAVCCVVSAVTWATWLLFTGVPAGCVVLRVRCPGPLGPRSPVCPLRVLFCVCGVLGHLAPVQRCARSLCCFACAVSWATWLLFTGVPALSFVLFVRCPGPLGSCSPVCPLGVLFRVCGVLGLLGPVHRCARPWCPVPLLPSVHARVRCPGPSGACSPVCALCAVHVCRWWLCPSFSPPRFRFCFSLKWKKRGARIHCRHRHGQLVQRCNSVVSSGVCRRCFGGGRAPGVRISRPDLHWLGQGGFG